MPSINQMKKTMVKQKIPMEIISKFDNLESNGNKYDDIITFVNQMDILLSKEQCLSVMEEQGCHKHESVVAPFRQFGIENANKTIEEKIKLLDKLESVHKPPCCLNQDGTLSIYWGHEQNGNYKCVCSIIPKLTGNKNITITYCGCCGGHVRNTFQYALGVKLKLKNIVSSPINSNGKDNCKFIFEIIQKK
jgi:hypothetical protein